MSVRPIPGSQAGRFPIALDIGLLLLGAILLVLLAYVLGHSILLGTADTSISAEDLRAAEWLDQYFPDIPHWYPLEGGGISLRHGSGILTYVLLVLLHRATDLSIVQAYRLLSFCAPVLAAIGVLVLGRWISNSWTAGLLASTLFLVAPAGWTWTADAGLLPQALALAFVPFALFSVGNYIRHQASRDDAGSRRLWLAVTVLLLSATLLAEPRVGIAAGAAMATYLLVASCSPLPREPESRGGNPIWALLSLATLTLAVASAYWIPLGRYVATAGVNLMHSASVQAQGIPSGAQMLGFSPIAPAFDGLRLQFSAGMIILSAIGLVVALRTTRRMLAVAAIGLLGFVVGIAAQPHPEIDGPIAKSIASVASELWVPSLQLALPVMAGIAAWSIARGIVGLGLSTVRRIFKVADRPRVQTPISDIAAFALASALVVPLIIGGGYLVGRDGSLAIGPGKDGLDPADIWGPGSARSSPGILAQLAPARWPLPKVSDEIPGDFGIMEVGLGASEAYNFRVDVSPNLEAPYRPQTSQVNGLQLDPDSQRISLLGPIAAYKENVFFSRDPGIDEHGSPISLASAARWFGIGVAVLNPNLDPVETYQSAGWSLLHRGTNSEAWAFPGELQLASLTNRPAILITEREGRDSYANFLQLANDGLFPYEYALLVEGGRKIDEYRIEELQSFDLVFLEAYDYGSRDDAWSRLEAYVRDGGSLFVDTGWQYAVAEWEFEAAPTLLPVSRLQWTDYGMGGPYALHTEEFAAGVDVRGFKPLVWEGQPWQLSGAGPEEVRDWGRVVLSMNGRPLIVSGQYGKGRIVWSGMNLVNHAQYLGLNGNELQLLRNIVSWLIRGEHGDDLAAQSLLREHPDSVELAFAEAPPGEGWLYWREAYHPNWRAKLITDQGTREIPLYRSGPGFMAAPLGTFSGSARVVLQWTPDLADMASTFASALGGLALLGLIVDGTLLRGHGFTWLKLALLMRIPRPFLGEGSNREWAERKRVELESGLLRPNSPPHLGRSDLRGGRIPDEGDARDVAAGIQLRADGGQSGLARGQAIEPPTDDVEQALLESWLNGSGHNDDAWAEKLLGRKKPAREQQSGR